MEPARVLSVNLGGAQPSAHTSASATGIGKVPHAGPVEIREPGPRQGGLGSGVVGDFIGDSRHHGGTDQAVYAFAREDLDRWERRLGRPLPHGHFGENLTTRAVDPNGARVGEVWRVGDTVELQVTYPRVPCATFRGWLGERGWVKTFAADGRPGAYLKVLVPGVVRAGDPVTLLHRPAHEVDMTLVLRALMGEPQLCARFAEVDPADLPDALAERLAAVGGR